MGGETKVEFNWNGDFVSKQINKALGDNLDLAGFSTLEVLKDLISRTQPTEIVDGVKIGLNPSKPGEPPKRVTGTLHKSYFWDRDRSAGINGSGEIRGRLGSPLKYAKELELGTLYKKPRPHLLPAFEKNRQFIQKALSRPVAGGG